MDRPARQTAARHQRAAAAGSRNRQGPLRPGRRDPRQGRARAVPASRIGRRAPPDRGRVMTPFEAALEYAAAGLPVFPCAHVPPPKQKRPLTPRGFHDASRDPQLINRWWGQTWPDAWIGMPTGKISRRWVLDIDVKRAAENGWDSLEDLGHLPLPGSPMVHTSSGGLHVYFDAGDRELRNSAGLIGAGLDVRGCGGYVVLPSPGSGYFWDPLYNFDTVPMAPAPDWLWPPKPSRPPIAGPIKPVEGLSPYGSPAPAPA